MEADAQPIGEFHMDSTLQFKAAGCFLLDTPLIHPGYTPNTPYGSRGSLV